MRRKGHAPPWSDPINVSLYPNFAMNTTKSSPHWKRFEFDGHAIYVAPDIPDWFVADGQTDSFLSNQTRPGEMETLHLARLRALTEREPPPPYAGRGQVLSLSRLKECWFHLTDACNLACRHCLFSASPASPAALPEADLRRAMAEARELGCTIFYFTGGEPFIYPNFSDVLRDLLAADPHCHTVVLTNGLLLREQGAFFTSADRERLHLQISLDGLEDNHERLRGTGTFARLLDNLAFLRDHHIRPTLSVAVNRHNVAALSAIVSLAGDMEVGNLHLLWHFVRGKGSSNQFVPPSEIWTHLRPALELADHLGIMIDNVEALKSQVFSSPGTRFDLSNSGWDSLAIGPDGAIYPSPALVGIAELRCGVLTEGLERVWRTSPVLADLRQTTLVGSAYEENPLRFLIGGGDIDHSYLRGGSFTGHDPYVELYNRMALWLIARQAGRYSAQTEGSILLRMGDVRHDCPEGGAVALTHCNCVISLGDDRGHATVREFYGRAAQEANAEIVNPFADRQQEADFIPAVSRQRSYGCGSPVQDAFLSQGETLVDLGSGSGVECFQGAAMVGSAGRVYGIDMTDAMLTLARSSQREVAQRLGFDNVEFRKGFLEEIPLEDSIADAVISNCVINLSPDKRRTLHEAFRILRPGGRLVVADIVTDEAVPAAIKNDEKLRGECLGGAMRQTELLAMLRATGFVAVRLLKRFPYRSIGNTRFYSLTFLAWKPAAPETAQVIYRGPFAGVFTESGRLLLKGEKTKIAAADLAGLDESVFILNQEGAVINIDQGGGCCGLPPESSPALSCCSSPAASDRRQHSDCMVCGSELRYFTRDRAETCHYCGEEKEANAVCLHGHFVCDNCHQDKGLAVIKKICTESAVEDMIILLKKIRSQSAISMHGPEHHAIIPGVILSAYRARGGKAGKKDILAAIERGSRVPGGVCGFWGGCGAALGVGIAFSVILEATPLTPGKRQQAQQATAQVLAKMAAIRAGRCCQRESVIALQEAASLSPDLLPVTLVAADTLHCNQYPRNRECIRKACLLWDSRDRGAETGLPVALVI